MTDYEALIKIGHSPAKASEIALDIQRREPYAISWMVRVRAMLEIASANEKAAQP